MAATTQRTDDLALWSLILGLLGLLLAAPLMSFFGWLAVLAIIPLGAIPAVLCGQVARVRMARQASRGGREGIALTGMVLGYVQIGYLAFVLPLMVAGGLPNWARSREISRLNACRNNLRMLQAAKDQAAIEQGIENGEYLDEEQVLDLLPQRGTTLICPNGGVYTIHPVGEEPECSRHGRISGMPP